jgi:tripartite ATP-independent transporter DctM subunit
MNVEIISGIALIGSMVVFFGIGIPVAFAIGLSALIYELISPLGSMVAMPQRMINGIDSFTLMAVPFFVLVGELMNTGGVTRRIFNFADALVGNKKGGLARVNVIASMIFAGMSGSAVADASGLGAVEMKAMEEKGYTKEFSAAVTAASSTIGPIIPPSIPFVIYGSVTAVSIGRLLLGGAIPGFILGGLFLLYISIISRFKDFPKPSHSRIKLRYVLKDLSDTFPALLTPIILVGGIILGFFTPTEASAIACLYSIILGTIIYKELSFKNIIQAFIRAALISSQILFIISAASYLGIVLAKAQVPQFVFNSFLSMFQASNIYAVLVLLNLLLIIMGCVIDTNPMLIIVCPILAPIAIEIGVDPVHFGVIIVFNLMIALLTPPVGMVTYTTCRVANCSLDKYTKELLPFLFVLIVGLVVVSVFPFFSTFLPNMLIGVQ